MKIIISPTCVLQQQILWNSKCHSWLSLIFNFVQETMFNAMEFPNCGVMQCSESCRFWRIFQFPEKGWSTRLKKKVADRKFTEHQSTKNQEQDLFQLLFFFLKIRSLTSDSRLVSAVYWEPDRPLDGEPVSVTALPHTREWTVKYAILLWGQGPKILTIEMSHWDLFLQENLLPR